MSIESKQSVISFEKLAYREMSVRGVPPAMASMVTEELNDALRSWLLAGHAVNIAGVGTLRLLFVFTICLNTFFVILL